MENICFSKIEQCDYQEDKVINGTLHYWFESGWVEYSKIELTQMLIAEQDSFSEYVNQTYETYII